MNFNNIDRGNSFDFGKTASEYAKYRDIYPEILYTRLHELGVGKADETYLDIGTGTGVLTKNMYKYGAEITGIDISEAQISAAKAITDRDNMNITYIACDAQNTPFSDNSFDSVTAAQCFWYFDREKIISEIKRVIKPGGVFVKVYLTYTFESEIAKKSHELVKEMNKLWTPAASGSADMYNHPFPGGKLEIIDCEIPFTRESWHGRMCACRGTMASMDESTLKKWNELHLKMLAEYPESFTVNHKLYIASYAIE